MSDIYIADGGITVGDASATRREVHTPVQETSDSAQVSIGWPGKVIAAGSVIEIGESFAVVHPGDYYNGLRGYKNAMDHLGMIMPAPGIFLIAAMISDGKAGAGGLTGRST